MVDEFTDVLHSIGMEWKPPSVEMLRVGFPAPQPPLLWRTPDSVATPVPKVEGFELLGGLTSVDTVAPIEHRQAQAPKRFWAHSAFFLARRLPWATRLAHLVTRVYLVALYGPANWKLTETAIRALRKWESSMLRRIVGSAWNTSEEWRSATSEWLEKHCGARRRLTW